MRVDLGAQERCVVSHSGSTKLITVYVDEYGQLRVSEKVRER